MWQAIFVVAGGALQFFGLALAAWDIWDAGRQWRAYERRGLVIEPLPAQAFGQAFDASVVTDPPPSIEVRVAAVEAKVARLDERLVAAAVQQRQEREERIAMTAGALGREVRRQDEAGIGPPTAGAMDRQRPQAATATYGRLRGVGDGAVTE